MGEWFIRVWDGNFNWGPRARGKEQSMKKGCRERRKKTPYAAKYMTQ